MKTKGALKVFDALSHGTRLKAFRLLVKYGEQGLAAGVLGQNLNIPDSTLSFHLLHLRHAKLVHSRKEGNSVIYSANVERLQELLRYLLSNYYEIEEAGLANIEALLSKKVAVDNDEAFSTH